MLEITGSNCIFDIFQNHENFLYKFFFIEEISGAILNIILNILP